MRSIFCIRRYTISLFAIIALTATLATSAAAQSAPLVMKIGTATINDSQHQWMKIFAGLVEKNSNGRIKTELYPTSQLGAIPRMIEGTQFGSIQCYVGPPEFLYGIDSRFEVLGAPGLFKDAIHASRALEDPEFNKAFLALGANKGLKGVALFLYSPMEFNTRTPVRTLADLKGMKLRVLASEMQMKQIRLLQATPVPMPLGDVAPALQQGTIDGQMTAGAVATPMRFYDAAKYMFETDHSMVTSLAVVSKIWFDKLPPDLQKVVSDAGQEAAREVTPWTFEFIARQRTGWTKAGGELNQPTAAEHEQLRKLLLPVASEVAAAKPEEKALFELLLKTAKRTE